MDKRILIFDDDEGIRDVCSFILTEYGWIVQTSTNSENILAQVSKFNPAVILMDNWIPGQGGVAATRTLKGSALKGIPVIFFSANSRISEIAQQAGADGYLGKPFELNDLEQLVQKFWEKQNK